MTKQQLKDYEKVQSLECLELWTCEGYGDLTEIPLRCAISDMEMLILDADAENFGADTARVVRLAESFIQKYKAKA